MDTTNTTPDTTATDRQTARIAAMRAVLDASTYEAEQAALPTARYVDLRPSLPATAVDLYHGWDERSEPDTTRDYVAVCKAIGAGYDRGARRYVIRREAVARARDALTAAGFLPCLHPSLEVPHAA